MAITPKQPLPKLLNKRQVKQQIQADVEAFLASGGEVVEVPKGRSGVAPDGFNRHPVCFANGATQRTLVPEVVANIEQRKQMQKEPRKLAHPKPRQARKRWIYDDFGEPLRWVWAE
ncbi:MAG: hypothetical protein GY881_02215 [Gammaproteobacteria bacterium]|nr:hypothetical protein [Gammaproteobacteria bacterium]MDP6166846.1 hypothetical protein [Gammaproteobacteria bacterium]